MNHFGLSRSRRCDNKNVAVAPKRVELKCDAPFILEGAEYIDAIMPVSKLTGNRMSIYEAAQMLGNEKFSRQLDAFLTEFKALPSDSKMSDADRIQLLRPRWETGCPVEDERFAKQLEILVDDFKDSLKSYDVNKETIKFDSSDANSPSTTE